MFRSNFIQIFGVSLLLGGLLGCGKPLQRPSLPKPTPTAIDRLILGRELTGKDLRDLFKVLNEKGEFDHLSQWIGQLSDAELVQWGKFLNTWMYQEALSPQGLVQLLKTRSGAKGFSSWEKNLEALKPGLSVLVDDEDLWNLLPRMVSVLDPQFVNSVIKPLSAASEKMYFSSGNAEIKTKAITHELFQLLKNEESNLKIQKLFELMANGQWVVPLSETSREWLKQSDESGFTDLATNLTEKIQPLNQALRLSKLLNRPAEKLVTVLQEGLRSNPDIVHALSMRWDPSFVRSLSNLVKQLLMKPEDGSRLDRDFWHALPRKEETASPTPEFIRLYSIVYSGVQKISDPRRLEPQTDSGSYKLPLQLNALFLTRFLEEVARQAAPQIQEMNPDTFEEVFWKSPIPLKDFRLNLTKEDSKKEVSEFVKKDLSSLGLNSALSRLESLVREDDSGKNSYAVIFSEENLTITQGFSEALASAHSERPFSDITPFLVTLVQSLSQSSPESGFNLDLLKQSPNLLAQVQGFLGQLDRNQWKLLKKLLFEELKIGQLELEDRALILGLFQSDPEVAEWVGEILANLQSIYLLDDTERSLFRFYHLFLRNIGSQKISELGEVFGLLSELAVFSESEQGAAVFPGLHSLLENGNNVIKSLRGLAGLKNIQVRLLEEKLAEVFGENLQEEKGIALFNDYLSRLAQRTEPELVSDLVDKFLKTQWNLRDEEMGLITEFSRKNGFSDLREILKSHGHEPPTKEVLKELKLLSEKKVINEGMQLLARIQNERMKEIALVILGMDQSGELVSLINSAHLFFEKGAKP